MQETDVLIVGQGLAGSWLSWWLEQAGVSCLVVDDADPASASRYAAGLINPVTGRRMVKTWMIEKLMPFAWKSYSDMGSFLQTDLISETAVVDFFPTVQMLQAFQKKYEEDPAYLQMVKGPSGMGGQEQGSPQDAREYENIFRFDLGWGVIHPCYLVKTEKLLKCWRGHLGEKKYLRVETFEARNLVIHASGIEYSDIRCRYIIFCDGKHAAGSPFFEKLPFALNKGEGLLVEINDIPQQTVYKKGMSLVPWKENIFWVGSSYQWEFEDERPTESFRSATENWLRNFLKVPFNTIDHFSALRPATLERRPFAGFHPKYPRVGILNGLGTKGCSLAPWFAAELAGKISGSGVIDPMADIKRFERVLMKEG